MNWRQNPLMGVFAVVRHIDLNSKGEFCGIKDTSSVHNIWFSKVVIMQ